MSADNWTTCFRCDALRAEAHAKKKEAVTAAYGVVQPAEFVELMRKLDEPLAKVESLREDYEIGLDASGYLNVSYFCSCSVCGFKFQFKHGEQAK